MHKVDRVVNSVFNSITWILSYLGCNQVWLVDCGDVEPIVDIVGNRKVGGVLLTHAHFDHIYGLPELQKRFPDCKIYTNENGKVTLANAKKNMSFFHELPVTVDGPYTIICYDCDTIARFPNITANVQCQVIIQVVCPLWYRIAFLREMYTCQGLKWRKIYHKVTKTKHENH